MLLVAIIVFAVVVVVLAALTFQNLQTDVVVVLFTWNTPSLPMGLLLIFAFCLGALVLYFVSAVWAWRDSRELRRLRVEVENLRRAVPSPAGPVAPVEGQVPPANAPVIPMPGMSQKPPDISDMPTLH